MNHNTMIFIAGTVLFSGVSLCMWLMGRKKMSLLYVSAIPLFLLDIYLTWSS